MKSCIAVARHYLKWVNIKFLNLALEGLILTIEIAYNKYVTKRHNLLTIFLSVHLSYGDDVAEQMRNELLYTISHSPQIYFFQLPPSSSWEEVSRLWYQWKSKLILPRP